MAIKERYLKIAPLIQYLLAPSNNASYYVITGDNTKTTSINLISDTANIGTSDNVRGWNITKVGTNAGLSFTYSNNDTSGQAARGANIVMNLNGFDNQVEFPTATNTPLPTNIVAKLVWAGDTNLYRSAASNLKTDGNLTIGGLTPAGVVHNDASGNLTSSLIVNADVSAAAAIAYSKLNLTNSIVNADINASAGIADTKLATISTAGKVANSATTATSLNTANAIVARDASGNFSAGTITASLTGAASLNVLKAGDTMTGTLVLPAGTTAAPSLQFTGSTNTGLSVATANTLSLDTNGTERISISTSKIITTLAAADQAIQSVTPTTNGSVTVNASTSILLLKHAASITNFTVNFPPNPVDGQLFSIVLGTTSSITLVNVGGTGGASVVNAVTALNPATTPPTNTTSNTGVTYLYSATANTWYRFSRG